MLQNKKDVQVTDKFHIRLRRVQMQNPLNLLDFFFKRPQHLLKAIPDISDGEECDI